MPSLAVTGKEYLRNGARIEARGPFTRRFLAEGDSWMDRSDLLVPALPSFLADEMTSRGQTNLIINISTAGDTLRRITDVMQGEFAWWLDQFAYDGILFSAGGNDFIDAARNPPPGTGLLRNMAGLPLPTNGYDCVDTAALSTLVNSYLNPNFNTIYQAIRTHPLNASAQIFLNGYDTPTARNAPAAGGAGPWLYTAYTHNGIAPSLWPALTAGLFRDIANTVTGWCAGRQHVHAVPTSGILVPAGEVPGNSGDWQNEIHPNRAGWRKQAKVWMAEVSTRLP
jgi:hypothetical protein